MQRSTWPPTWDEVRGVPLLTETDPEGVRVAFTKRPGGVSRAPFDELNLSSSVGDEEGRVAENRRRAARAAGFDPDRVVSAKQVHGSAVLDVPAGACGVLGEGDALVTGELARPVSVMTADCVPVLLAGHGRVAAVHAGWRGLVAGVVEAALARLGGAARAWIGPSIKACCYEVGAEVVDAFAGADLPVASSETPLRVDPSLAAATILERNGVAEVRAVADCTHCDPSFFSYRRDGRTGRQGAFIWIA